MLFKSKRYIFLFLAPTIILMTVFLYYPLVLTIKDSFYDWYSFSISKVFIGLKNYKDMFYDDVIRKSLWHTVIFMIVVVIFQVGIALVLALFVDSIKRGKKLYRLLFFFPVVISGTAIGLMFRLSYEYQYGLLNTIGAFFGMPKRVWLDSGTSLIACIIPTAWQYVGFYFVIFLTAMSKVPEDIYESAILDGIDGIKKARYITIPLIWDTVATSIALVVAGTLKAFDIFFIITKGGPMNSSELLSTYMYTKVFSGQNNGYGCAIAVLIIILGFGLTMISNKLTERESVMM